MQERVRYLRNKRNISSTYTGVVIHSDPVVVEHRVILKIRTSYLPLLPFWYKYKNINRLSMIADENGHSGDKPQVLMSHSLSAEEYRRMRQRFCSSNVGPILNDTIIDYAMITQLLTLSRHGTLRTAQDVFTSLRAAQAAMAPGFCHDVNREKLTEWNSATAAFAMFQWLSDAQRLGTPTTSFRWSF